MKMILSRSNNENKFQLAMCYDGNSALLIDIDLFGAVPSVPSITRGLHFTFVILRLMPRHPMPNPFASKMPGMPPFLSAQGCVAAKYNSYNI